MKNIPYKWYRAGDVNAFFGLMLDNIAGLALTVTLLSVVFGFPVDFALKYMIPGTAIGVLVGDLLFFWLAFRLAKKENRTDVCAMPLGLDTPSTLGMVFFVLGPAFVLAKEAGLDEQAAAMQTWHIGICAIFVTGLIKIVCAFGSNWIRNVFPRAGLLGSLAAIALVLIAFTPMLEVAKNPVVGFASLVIVLVTLVARGKLPLKIPGAAGAVIFGCAIYYLILLIEKTSGINIIGHAPDVPLDPMSLSAIKEESLTSLLDMVSKVTPEGERVYTIGLQKGWLEVFHFEWINSFGYMTTYLPYVIPFAIATVIGGIDCAESAASAGDDFDTGKVIGIEAVATLVAAMCGGVVQTTPYIGHPAYKAMGGRAAYVLMTALFVGGAGLFGYFNLLYGLIPAAVLVPILIFIGLEITAQSFHANPVRHYAAIAIACLPAMAKLVWISIDKLNLSAEILDNEDVLAVRLLAGGFIITSLIWASALAKIIDRRFVTASLFFAFAGIFVLFGVMHTPLNGEQMFWPWQLNPGFADWMSARATSMFGSAENPIVFEPLEEGHRQIITEFAIAYLVMAVTMFLMGWWSQGRVDPIDSDEEFEKLMQ